MKGMLECYVQGKPSGEENLQALVSLLFDAGTANCADTNGYDSFLLNSTRSVSHIAGAKIHILVCDVSNLVILDYQPSFHLLNL